MYISEVKNCTSCSILFSEECVVLESCGSHKYQLNPEQYH
jgi:hypothetical protein